MIVAAARLFRERGFDGVSIADVTKSAGLTHGVFYGHFKSKEELMAEACRCAVDTMLKDWRAATGTAGADAMAAITVPYLSMQHRRNAGTGCLMAALGPEVSRHAGPVRRAVTECLRAVLDELGRLTAVEPAARRRSEAIATFITMVGALVVVRAISDSKLAEEILQVASASVSRG